MDQCLACDLTHGRRPRPVHIHYIVQPVTKAQMAEFGCPGPTLQTAMFAAGRGPAADQVEAIAEQARIAFSARTWPGRGHQ